MFHLIFLNTNILYMVKTFRGYKRGYTEQSMSSPFPAPSSPLHGGGRAASFLCTLLGMACDYTGMYHRGADSFSPSFYLPLPQMVAQ